MPFSQPYIPAITIPPVLVSGIDYLQWQCISGESFPPVLPASFFSYGSWAARPGVKSGSIAAVGSPGPLAAWPILPRVGFGQTVVGTVTWTFNIAIDSTAFFNSGSIFLGQYVRFDYRTDTHTWNFVTTSASTVTTSAASALDNFAWHSVSVSITAAGFVAYQLDGVTLASYTLNTPGLFNGDVIQPSWRAFGSNGVNVYVSNMKVAWS